MPDRKDRVQDWGYDIDVSHTALDWDWQQRHIHPKHSVVWAGDALTLDTGEAIPVSRRYYPDFMARYVESLR